VDESQLIERNQALASKAGLFLIVPMFESLKKIEAWDTLLFKILK
jgi:hypothetical protein